MLSIEQIEDLQKLALRKGRSLRKEADNVGYSMHWPMEHMRPEMVERLRKWLETFPDKKPYPGGDVL